MSIPNYDSPEYVAEVAKADQRVAMLSAMLDCYMQAARIFGRQLVESPAPISNPYGTEAICLTLYHLVNSFTAEEIPHADVVGLLALAVTRLAENEAAVKQ